MADTGAPCSAGEAPVRNEGHRVTEPHPHECRRRGKHLAHAGAAPGPLVTDNETVAALDALSKYGLHRRLLRVEDTGTTCKTHHLFRDARLLYNGAERCDIAVEDGYPPLLVECLLHGAYHLVVDVIHTFHNSLYPPPRNGRVVPYLLTHPVQYRRHTASPVEILHVVVANGLQR